MRLVRRSKRPTFGESTGAAMLLEAGDVAEGQFEGLIWRQIVSDPMMIGQVVVLGLVVFLGVFGPLFTRNATGINLNAVLLPPSLVHWMGTDDVGRDVFARFCAGARISLSIGAIVVLIGGSVGGAVGLLAGAVGGWLENAVMRVVDALLAFPPLILAMAVTVALGPGLVTATAGITLTAVPWYARLIRSDVVRLRGMPFVEGSVATGASQRRIIVRHIAPQLATTFLIQAAAIFSYAVLTMAALSYIGLGAQPPTPEWGQMITSGEQYALTGAWWISVFPGLGVLAVTTSVGLMSDRASELLDPRGKR